MHKILGGLRQHAASTCRCPSCNVSQTTAAISHRAGTVATGAARRHVLTSTTILCSGITTAAAYVDAESKTRRREQWDKAISELKDDVATATIRNDATLLHAFDQDTIVDSDKKWLDLVSGQIPLPSVGSIAQDELAWNSAYRDKQTKDDGRWTPKKIAITNLATKRMKLRLLQVVKENSLNVESIMRDLDTRELAAVDGQGGLPVAPTRHSASVWLGRSLQDYKSTYSHLYFTLRRAWKATHNLEETDTPKGPPLKSYTRRMPSSAKVVELHSKLRDLFGGASSEEASRFLCLARAVDIMDCSGITPDLNTYNIMLAGLMKLGIPHTVNIAIHALRQSNLQPNEVTLSLVLQHFTITNNRAGFERWLGLIRGEASGLSLRNPREVSNNFLTQDSLGGHTRQPTKMIWLPTPTPLVFSAIVAGKLHFDGLREALLTCKRMGAHGWYLDFDGFGPLLRFCASHRDVDAGEQIWRVAQQIQRRASQVLQAHRADDVRIPRHVYAAMLHLYDTTGSNKYAAAKSAFEAAWPVVPAVTAQQVAIDPEHEPGGTRTAQRIEAVAHQSDGDTALLQEAGQVIQDESQAFSSTLNVTSDLCVTPDMHHTDCDDHEAVRDRLSSHETSRTLSRTTQTSDAVPLRWRTKISFAPRSDELGALPVSSPQDQAHVLSLGLT